MFKVFDLNLKLVAQPFDNLKYRDRTVLIMCRDGHGNYLLGEKENHYPEGIVRLLGGGVDKEENVTEAAMREIKEEMDLVVEPEELMELAEVRVVGDYKGKIFRTSIIICYLNTTKDDYLAGDDVTKIFKYSEKDFRQLIENFNHLKDDNLFEKSDTTHSWGDYGKVYGFVHQVALDEVLKRSL